MWGKLQPAFFYFLFCSLAHFLSVFFVVVNVYSSGALLTLFVVFKFTSSSSMRFLIIEHIVKN